MPLSERKSPCARRCASGCRNPVGWLLPLRAFLGYVYLYAGLSKVADGTFLGGSSPLSMHASVVAIRGTSPIGGLLGPVQRHSFGFGVLMATAELAVGLGLVLGQFTRVAAAAAGGMLLALSLWLTVSWGAQPWFTSADLVYLFALSPLLIVGAAGVLSLDGWLDRVRDRHPGASEDYTRRVLLGGGAAVVGGVLLGGAALSRESSGSSGAGSIDSAGTPVTLTSASEVPVGGAKMVSDGATGQDAWVLQLKPGVFSAVSAVCPHQGCSVNFVSVRDGFACPCHGSRFDVQGHKLAGPSPRGLAVIPVVVDNAIIRTR